MSNISLNYAQIIDPLSFKSINLAKIYIGEYGTLPNPANASTWKQAYFVNSDGTRTAASQPIRTNAAGYAVDGSGNIKTIQVDGGYSLLVQDQYGATKFSQACSHTNNGAVLEFDIIASFTGAPDGAVVFFKGRDSVGDGGGGTFRYSSLSTAIANGGTVFSPSAGGRLIRQYDGDIDVRWFGVKGDGVTDDTAAIQQWASSVTNGVFQEGTFLLSGTITLSSNGFVMRGAGRTKTIFKMTTDSTAFKSANAGVGRSFDGTLQGFTVQGFSATTARILDFRGASYYRVRDVQVTGDSTGTAASSSIGLDMSRGAASFNGYITLDGYYCIYCQTGLIAEVNQLSINGGLCNNNSVRGAVIQTSADVSIINVEYSGNGEGFAASYVGAFPSGKYDKGGLLIDNTVGVFVTGTWGERNAHRGTLTQYGKNDVEITSTCRRVTVLQGRPDNAPYGKNHGLSLDYGVVGGDGIGNALQSTFGLIANGQMAKVDVAGKPYGWTAVGAITYATASTLPAGVSGVRLTASSGVPKFYQQMLTASQCALLPVGTRVCATFWVNAVTNPWATGYCRVGITTAAGGASAGTAYISAQVSPAYAQRVTVEYTITGTEPNGISFFAEFFQSSGTWSVEIGDVCANVGTTVFRNFDRPITSDGGTLGGVQITYGTAAPTSGSWVVGDTLMNIAPSELGTAGSKYIIDRWRCVASGSPGTWLQCRALTGN